jgi:hypothetical protein
MHKLLLATALLGAMFIPESFYSGAALAQGLQRQMRPPLTPRSLHRWGDRDFQIIRWAYGDCKIWFDDNGPPVGVGWVVLADGLRTRDEAWRVLVRLQAIRMCA